jgi:hypothetical protein
MSSPANGTAAAGGAGYDLTSPAARPDVATPSKMVAASEDFGALPPIDGMKICCLGAGYVGGPTMAMIAKSACCKAPACL